MFTGSIWVAWTSEKAYDSSIWILHDVSQVLEIGLGVGIMNPGNMEGDGAMETSESPPWAPKEAKVNAADCG